MIINHDHNKIAVSKFTGNLSHDDNTWWQYMMTIHDDNAWWQYMMTIHDDNGCLEMSGELAQETCHVL